MTARDAVAPAEGTPELSLLGGPLHRLARWLGRESDFAGHARLGAALAIFAWLPLMLLALLAEGAMPTIGAHVRFLLAIPLLLVSEARIDPQFKALARQLVQSGIVTPAALPGLVVTIRRVSRLRDSVIAEAVLLVVSLSLLRLQVGGAVTSWTTAAGGQGGVHLTPAGIWYLGVSLTVFRFLFLRWCWRTGIWWWFNWRLSRLELRLIPAHPDRMGGLGYLESVQSFFAADLFAYSAVISASFAEQIRFDGTTLDALRVPVAGVLALFAFLMFAPLFFFVPKLQAVRLRGLREYGQLAQEYVSAFHAKWIRRDEAPGEGLLGTPDLSGLSDLGSSVKVVQEMRVVPFGRTLVRPVAAASLIPMAPLLLTKFPLDVLLTKILRMIAGA